MSIIKALLRDRSGSAAIQTAFLVGLTSSAILVVVRIGVAAAVQ